MLAKTRVMAVALMAVSTFLAAYGLPEEEDRGYHTVSDPQQLIGEWRYIGARGGVFLMDAPETEEFVAGRDFPVVTHESYDTGIDSITFLPDHTTIGNWFAPGHWSIQQGAVGGSYLRIETEGDWPPGSPYSTFECIAIRQEDHLVLVSASRPQGFFLERFAEELGVFPEDSTYVEVSVAFFVRETDGTSPEAGQGRLSDR